MPEFFVARDRARRIGWNLEKVLQERRLAWRGAEIGMASLRDDADLTLAAIAGDARSSIRQVLDGEIRDRERGFMEIPFVVALTSVATRIETAADLEAGRRLGPVKEKDVRRRIEEALASSLRRLEAFQAAYDEKTPLSEPRSMDLAHLLLLVSPAGERPWDTAPPPVVTSPAGLEDLLLAVRTALPDAASAWHVVPSALGRRLQLALGSCEGQAGAVRVPPDVQRAADVLAFHQPVEVTTWAEARPDGTIHLTGLTLELDDPAGQTLAAAVAIATGGEARLSPEAERAVHALMATPPVPDGGDASPERLVALLGLLQILDRELKERIAPRFLGPMVRMAAAELPRETTRKAPLKPAFLEALQKELGDVPVERLGDLATKAARGRLEAKSLGAIEIALLLAVAGRQGVLAGTRLERHVDVGALSDDDVLELARDLGDVGTIRKRLEAGRDVEAQALVRLECAAVAALGRIGRLKT